jgi:hypothetical protein
VVHCSCAKKGDVLCGRRKRLTGGPHTRGLRSGGCGTARVHRGIRPQSVLWARCGGGSCGTIALSRDYSLLQTGPTITGAGSFKMFCPSIRVLGSAVMARTRTRYEWSSARRIRLNPGDNESRDRKILSRPPKLGSFSRLGFFGHGRRGVQPERGMYLLGNKTSAGLKTPRNPW